MGGFLLISSPPAAGHEAAGWSEHADAVAQELYPAGRVAVHRAPGLRLWTFAREDGSGGGLARDEHGRWLAAVGTWLADDGLGSGDEAALLERLARAGPAAVARSLDGPAVLIAGGAAGTPVTVITDRFADCRAYWRRAPGGSVALCSSSLLLEALWPGQLDAIGLQEFLYTGIVYEDRTLFASVRRLPPASVISVRPGGEPQSDRYWHPAGVAREDCAAAAAERLWEGLVDAARRIAGRHPRAVVDLTGGYDSRAVLAGFRGAGLEVVATVRGDPGDPDVQIAAEIAGRTGLRLERFPARTCDPVARIDGATVLTDGEFEAVEYAGVAALHRRLSRAWRASVSGSFGELARGYWLDRRERRPDDPGPIDAEALAARRLARDPHDPAVLRAADRIDLVSHMAGVVRRTVAGLHEHPRIVQLDTAYAWIRMAGWHARIASATNRIWPNCSPFMFRAVAEAAIAAPGAARRGGLLVRRMLAHHDPELARFRLADGHPAEPLSVRNAHRFVPLALDLGRRLGARLLDRLVAAPAGDAENLRLRARIRRELRPALRSLAPDLLDPAALDGFVDRAAAPDFRYHDQWLRLLTLERCLFVRERAAAAGRAARSRRFTA